MKRTLFVYGTLLSGEYNHHHIEGQELIGEGTIGLADLFDTGYGFPCIIPGKGTVHGEVWNVDEEHFQSVERLEGDMYIRKNVVVMLDSGDACPAEAYFWAVPGTENLRPIESGSWRE